MIERLKSRLKAQCKTLVIGSNMQEKLLIFFKEYFCSFPIRFQMNEINYYLLSKYISAIDIFHFSSSYFLLNLAQIPTRLIFSSEFLSISNKNIKIRYRSEE